MIEPHLGLLKKPDNDSLLYKVIPANNFFSMLEHEYLYFRRVDTYKDDSRDSDQPDNLIKKHQNIAFENNPDFNLFEYYSRCRSRIYACCFSTKNTNYIWNTYSNGDNNAICLVLNSALLIDYLNSVYSDSKILHQSKYFKNFFFINYGLVTYGEINSFLLNKRLAANPIEFAYFKDNQYASDEEFRITLATHSIYKAFKLPDGSPFEFPESICIQVSLRNLLLSNALNEILISESRDEGFNDKFHEKLTNHGIEVKYK